jgi:hypothetical protein
MSSLNVDIKLGVREVFLALPPVTFYKVCLSFEVLCSTKVNLGD